MHPSLYPIVRRRRFELPFLVIMWRHTPYLASVWFAHDAKSNSQKRGLLFHHEDRTNISASRVSAHPIGWGVGTGWTRSRTESLDMRNRRSETNSSLRSRSLDAELARKSRHHACWMV